LFKFFPPALNSVKMFLQQYGMIILIFFIFFNGLGGLYSAAYWLYNIVTGF
jgi:hypothetical protein